MTTATLTEAPPSAKVEPYRLSPQAKRVFIALMLGMLVASISQTIVGPAMPRIVAELGGIDHYSWLATAAMLVSAITVPDRRQDERPLRTPRLLPRRPRRLHGRLGPSRLRPELLVAHRRPRHPGRWAWAR